MTPADGGPGRTPTAVGLTIAEEPSDWNRAGFTVGPDGICWIGPVRLDLAGGGAGDGVVGWTLADLPEGAPPSLDGFATRALTADDRVAGPPSPAHPNGVSAVDHIVLLTDDLERTDAAAATLGLIARRTRDHTLPDGSPVRQRFYVVGPFVLEVVAPSPPPAESRPGVRSFGIALVAPDLDETARRLGDLLGPVRAAVQSGRRIATLRGAEVGLSTPVALMSPRPRRA